MRAQIVCVRSQPTYLRGPSTWCDDLPPRCNGLQPSYDGLQPTRPVFNSGTLFHLGSRAASGFRSRTNYLECVCGLVEHSLSNRLKPGGAVQVAAEVDKAPRKQRVLGEQIFEKSNFCHLPKPRKG